MDFYQDYINFKEDKEQIINFLIENNSNLLSRFKHVLAVIDFYSEQHISNITLDHDEENIFQTGFEYIFDRLTLLELMGARIFNNDFNEMEKFSRTINLVLYTNDFKDEVLNIDENNETSIAELSQYEETILKILESKQHATDVEIGLLNELSIKIFDELGEEYYGLNEIFYDIALELGIIDEDDDDTIDVGL
ncbi:MAG: hypothetical protein R3Y05_00785 [bacterium]